MEFFDRYFHIHLPIITKHELGSSLSPWKPSHKIWYKSVHNCFSYNVHRQTDTHTHTDTQTDAGENIFPRFRLDNYHSSLLEYVFTGVGLCVCLSVCVCV